MLYTEYGLSEGKRKSLEILERERLLAFGKTELTPVAWFDVTFMGVRFVRDCSPSGRERARKHAEEQKAKIVQVQPVSPEVREAITRALSGRGA
jgi:hypothetical protein